MKKSADVLTADLAESAASQNGRAGRRPALERSFAEVLADVVHVEQVPVDSHFFDDLGADSLVMAHFCARVRKRADLPSVSMKDIYQHPTISSLAAALAGRRARRPCRVRRSRRRPRWRRRPARGSTSSAGRCSSWSSSDTPPSPRSSPPGATTGSPPAPAASTSTCGRSLFGGALFVVLCTLPILAKWLLIGRWKPQRDPRSGAWRTSASGSSRRWSASNPLVLLFAGSPLYALYLRALGAKIGRGVAILSRHVPVCTDLLTIGDGTVIRKDSFFSCYRAHAGHDPDRPGHPRQGRVRRREDGARHRHLDGRRGPARPRLLAARRPGGARRRAAGTAPRRSAPRSDYRTVEPAALRHRCAGSAYAVTAAAERAASCTCRWPIGGAYLLLDRGPAARRAAGPAAVVRHVAGRSTSTPWSSPSCSSSASLLVGLLVRGHRPAPAQPRSSSRTRSIRCTASTTASTGRSRGMTNVQVLHATCSATAPTSSTTCAGSATTCPGSSRPGRTSARR